MRAFLINFLIDYSEDLPFVPSPLPTLAPSTISPKSQRSVKHPSVHLTDLPMEPQVNVTTLSSQGCVEKKSQGTKVPYSECKLVLGKSKLTDKKSAGGTPCFPARICIFASTPPLIGGPISKEINQ
jgi:hypothetical protein